MPALPLQVGTIAIATRASGACDVGEVGMCSEGHTLGGHPGDSFLCEQGRYDRCSPEDGALFLTVPDSIGA